MNDENIVRVGRNSPPAEVAGAIAGIYRDTGTADVRAIGASAVNQMVKAVAIAIDYLKVDGLDIACVPGFVDVEGVADSHITAIRMTLIERDGVGDGA